MKLLFELLFNRVHVRARTIYRSVFIAQFLIVSNLWKESKW